MTTNTSFGLIKNLKRLVPTTIASLFLVACETVPPSTNVSVSDLEQQHARVQEKETMLAELANSLKSQEKQLAAREQSLTRQEQQLAAQRKAIEKEKENLQLAEFRARLAPEQPVVARTESLVVGEIERVYLDPPGINLEARIDTGSEMSRLYPLSATNFERDGKPYVSFILSQPDSSETVEITRRIREQVRVKGGNGKSYKRDVVRLRVVLGKIDERVDFALEPQAKEKTQVTIGRNVLRDLAVVDVSKQFVTSPQL